MKRPLAKAAARTPRRAKHHPIDVVTRAASASPFLAFRYARMEISARDGRADVNATHTLFENGTLTTERLAGEVDRAVYERIIASAEQAVLAQAASWLRAFSFFLPLPPTSRDDRD
jgi:hypothetical protein